MLKTVSITVAGIVQGVFYRQRTKELATALNIKGVVRNKPDDTVEVIATGTPEQIEQLVKWCWSGPPRAKVVDVIVRELPVEMFDKFSVAR